MIARGSAVVVIGVSGAGKSTVGRRLAQVLDVPFLEGDDFHPPANIQKMSHGIALDDADRGPWLDALAAAVNARRSSGGIVATCSALKRRYRDRLRTSIAAPLLFACLSADRATLAARLRSRQNHFMPESLLDSQLASFEPPATDEPARLLAADRPIEALISDLISASPSDSTTSPRRTGESS
jgi:gluconokinase